jgi:hypothetical protein
MGVAIDMLRLRPPGGDIAIIGTIFDDVASASGSGLCTIPFTGLTIQENDYVVVFINFGRPTIDTTWTSPAGNSNGAYATLVDLYKSGTNNHTNLGIFALKQGATPDTSFTVDTQHNSEEFSYIVRVYRGVDQATALDVAAQTANGSGIDDAANPPSITPITSGSEIISVYAASQQSSQIWSAPSDITNFTQARDTSGTGGKHGSVAIGHKVWTSGAFDPAAVAAANVDSRNSWIGVTIALRPQL